MFNNFTISEKFFIKNVVDIFLLVVIFAIFSLLKIYHASIVQTALTMLVMFVAAFLIQFLTNLWLNNYLNKAVQKKSHNFKQKQNVINEMLAKQIQALNSYMETTKDYANDEKDLIKSNTDKLTGLKQRIQIIADLILELNEYNQQITSNVGIVENIAEQTNMLALNATVEAARAGEHGKGFSVVASEIRKLADEAKIAANKISSLINEVQTVTHSTVMATEEGTKEIEVILKNAETADDTFNDIMTTVKSISENVKTITSDTQKIFSEEVEKSEN
ncbi:hypothetical protein IJ707_01045 [bacterium]|nr:hypothetical protein [bacterium]